MQNKMKHSMQLSRRIAAASVVAISGLALVLSGCSAGLTSSAFKATPQPSLSGLHGVVHGGQNAIGGATIQLYQISNAGYGQPAIPLLPTGANAVTTSTDGSGSFGITGLYTCAPNTMVYLTGTGGAPGLGQSTNSSIALMTYLGSCTALQQAAASPGGISVSVNEETTIAAVYALAGYMTGYANAGYTGTSLAGLNNAFTTASVLASPYTGQVPGVAATSGVTYPTLNLAALANSVAACINSAGDTGSNTACDQLFVAATVNGAKPADTIAALANIAHNPALTSAKVSTIFNIPTIGAPFGPALPQAPADWTMAIKYTGGGISAPTGIAIDASGDAWVSNGGGNAVTEIAGGGFTSGSTGYASPYIAGAHGIAIDATGNVWLANTGANNLLELSSAGAITNTITSGIAGPVSVALDSSSNVWVANIDGNSIAAFNSAGTPLGFSPITNAALASPTGIAVDGLLNYVWVSSSTPNQLALFNTSTGAYVGAATDGLVVAPGGIATDLNTSGNVWSAATGINTVFVITGTSSGNTAFSELSTGGVSMPVAVAVDGNSNVWTVNDVTAGSISGFTSAGAAITPATGLSTLNAPMAVAPDASGNLWTANSGDNSVTEFVGLAGPTVTPLVSSPR